MIYPHPAGTAFPRGGGYGYGVAGSHFDGRWARWRAPLPLGRRGEKAAERYLRRQGYVLVARGQRDRLGEIDLVAIDGRTVVFVEVKTRSSVDALPTRSLLWMTKSSVD